MLLHGAVEHHFRSGRTAIDDYAIDIWIGMIQEEIVVKFSECGIWNFRPKGAAIFLYEVNYTVGERRSVIEA